MICPCCKCDPCQCEELPVRQIYFHGIDPKKWARKHGIHPFEAPCQGCGKVQETTLPMILGNRRGLAINCECGSRVPYCFVIPDWNWEGGLLV